MISYGLLCVVTKNLSRVFVRGMDFSCHAFLICRGFNLKSEVPQVKETLLIKSRSPGIFSAMLTESVILFFSLCVVLPRFFRKSAEFWILAWALAFALFVYLPSIFLFSYSVKVTTKKVCVKAPFKKDFFLPVENIIYAKKCLFMGIKIRTSSRIYKIRCVKNRSDICMVINNLIKNCRNTYF